MFEGGDVFVNQIEMESGERRQGEEEYESRQSK